MPAQNIMSVQAGDGNWLTPTFLGRAGVTEVFAIVAMVADVGSPASQEFRRWLEHGCRTGEYPGISTLPQGLTEMDAIIVTIKG